MNKNKPKHYKQVNIKNFNHVKERKKLANSCEWYKDEFCNRYNTKCFYCEMYLKERATPKKSCKTCEHFKYGIAQGKASYYCEIDNKLMSSYNAKTECKSPKYKKKA